MAVEYKKRYLVVEGSQTAHCCFTHTVVDTTKPVMIGNKQYIDVRGNAQFEAVCECFDHSTARRIEAALNGESHVREQ